MCSSSLAVATTAAPREEQNCCVSAIDEANSKINKMLRARFALYTAERDRCTGIPLEPSAATGPMVDRTRSIVVDFVQCLFRGEHMTPVLYYFPPSPPCRTLLLLGRLLGLEFELRVVDVLQGEQLKPDFVKVSAVADNNKKARLLLIGTDHGQWDISTMQLGTIAQLLGTMHCQCVVKWSFIGILYNLCELNANDQCT